MRINIVKTTGIEDLQRANSFTTGRESNMSLRRAYALGHSPIRTQRFRIELYDIPLFVASQLVRSHVAIEWYMRSARPDNGAPDFRKVCADLADDIVNYGNMENLDKTAAKVKGLADRFDRYKPTDLLGELNAECLINLSHKRLCATASKETREIWKKVCELVEEIDPDLYPYLVKPCVASGVCRESKCCGFIRTDDFISRREKYVKLFCI